MKEDVKVTMIVPVYNAERYLEECLNSLCNQNYNNIEIIVINDGSLDRSELICREFSKKDVRINFISQEHAGVVAARKRGIDIAKGKYLAFVDSDDCVESSYVAYLVENMDQGDIITSNLRHGTSFIQPSIFPGVYSGTEMDNILANMLMSGINVHMIGKMFKTELAKEVIKEVDDRIYFYEDAEFVYRYLLKCNNITILDYCGYTYRFNNNSVSHRVHEDYLENLNYLYLSLKDAFENSDYGEILIPQLQKWIGEIVSRAVQIMGFPVECRGVIYLMPIFSETINHKIVLYGAGSVGRDYMRQIKAQKCYLVAAWVDTNWNYLKSPLGKIESPECLADLSYDFIIVALKDPDVVETVIKTLIMKGVKRECILWREPISSI